MKITVRVKPNAKQERVAKRTENEFDLWVKAEAKEGKANLAVIELLSEYFDIAKGRITIIQGKQSKNKIISIEG